MGQDATESLLELREVTKAFGAVRALKAVSFTLRAGEVHALLGENGAGKSTLIKTIAGAHAPDSGQLRIQGEVVSELTPAQARALGITCIYQQPALFPDLTVAENIRLRLEASKACRWVRWNVCRREARALLDRVGGTFDVDTEVRALSMPQQQLVEMACALGAGARVVIMDEPTASLTRQDQERLFGVVRSLRNSGLGVIYITHRLEEIFQLADRVTVLRDGESIGTWPVSAMTEPLLIEKMVGREVAQIYPPSESQPGDVVLALRKLGCSVSGVQEVDLEIRAGEVVGLAGLVGAGRTELARVLFGITPADRGEILLGGQPVRVGCPQDAVERGIAYLPEDRRRHGVILDLPISSNVTMAVHRQLFPGSWLRGAVEQELTQRFVADLEIKTASLDAPGKSLSGGNQQKVALARWLATKPRVLILDEPTQGVDVGAKAEIHRIIRSLAKQGLAVLMISSDLPEVLGMSDRIGVMRGGRLVTVLPGGVSASQVMAMALGQEGREGGRQGVDL